MDNAYIAMADDLAELRDWQGTQMSDDPSDAVLRRGSAILRRFLVDQDLQKAWIALGLKSIKSEPAVTAYEIDVNSELYLPPQHLILADGMFEMGQGPLPPEAERVKFRTRQRTMGLNDFRKSACVLVNGDLITRGELIQYFANTQGGVHMHVNGHQRPKHEMLMRRIEKARQGVTLFKKEALYFEFREIGRRLGESADLQVLEGRIRNGA